MSELSDFSGPVHVPTARMDIDTNFLDMLTDNLSGLQGQPRLDYVVGQIEYVEGLGTDVDLSHSLRFLQEERDRIRQLLAS